MCTRLSVYMFAVNDINYPWLVLVLAGSDDDSEDDMSETEIDEDEDDNLEMPPLVPRH